MAEPCETCSGTAEPLGQLGRLVWYRCRACGWQFSLAAEDDDQDQGLS